MTGSAVCDAIVVVTAFYLAMAFLLIKGSKP